MVRNHSTRPTLLTAALVLVSIVSSLGSIVSRGDPSVSDNGNGTKTAAWDFTNPANYTAANIAMTPNDATLGLTSGGWTQTSDADFSGNGTPDSATRVTNGSVQLSGNEASLVANGDFSQASGWTWVNGSNGTTLAQSSSETGQFSHATGQNNSRFDSMDTGAGWTVVASLGATSTAVLDPSTKVEGLNSMKDAITLPSSSMWAGISRTGTTWNLTPFNRISVWMNTTLGGSGLTGYLHLATSTSSWNSTAVSVPTAWRRVEFDIAPFGANLSLVTRFDLRFTGAVVATVDVYVDDIWSLYRKSVDDAALISQIFSKPTTGNGQPGSVLLWWDSVALQISNVSVARLTVTIRNQTGSSRSSSVDYTGATSWVTRSLDISALMAPAGSYAISFIFRVAIDTPFPTGAVVGIDNVVLKAPDFIDGLYTSKPFDPGTPALWGRVSWTAQDPAQTTTSIQTRSGSTPSPGDSTWSPWRAHVIPEPIGSPNARYIQFQILLHTANSSRTP